MAIWADTVVKYEWDVNGDKCAVVDMFSDDKPSSFPTTGAEVDKMDDELKIIAPSSVYVISDASLWLLKSDGTWAEQ